MSIIEDVIGLHKEKIKEIKVILEAIKGDSEKNELNKNNCKGLRKQLMK